MHKTKLILSILLAAAPSLSRAQVDWGNLELDERPICDIHWDEAPQSTKRKSASQATAPLRAVGEKKIPVVLVAFADMPFIAAETDAAVNEYYQKFCNGTRDGNLYKGHGSYGCIRDFFAQQSDSAFLPEFVIIGPVTLDNGYATYGQNSGGKGTDKGFTQFRSDALTKAMEVYNDWSIFDNDGNGNIDMVFFVFAGMGENNTQGKYPDLLWPKETIASTTINSTVFATSAITCEARPKTWNEGKTQVLETKTDGVGVFIHELSHALGLPDFYDTNYKAFGMDIWSVMDYGEYGIDNGFNPGNYTAYERDFMGWRPLIELTEPCVVTIPCFADGGYGYKIQNEASANEYYVIENRQAKGWDNKICTIGHGLQVTHVDYDATKWNTNNVNTDKTHQRMTIIAANNRYIGTSQSSDGTALMQTWQGNLYPGDTYNYSLTDESTPAAEVFTGVLIHKPLRNITENTDGTVTVCFCTNGKLDTPEVRDAANIGDRTFDAVWDAVDYATEYEVELYKDDALLTADVATEATMHFEDLQPSSHLKYRVKAKANSPEDWLDSEWSDFCFLDLLPDYIDAVPESEKPVDVYTMSGIRVSRCFADEIGRLSLRRGVYVIRYPNGATKKVMIQ